MTRYYLGYVGAQWRVFHVFCGFSTNEFMTVVADKLETVYKRTAKRLQCTVDEVEFYDVGLKRLGHSEIKEAINYYPEGGTTNLYAFKAGQDIDLSTHENRERNDPITFVGFVVNDQLDIVHFSTEKQLFDYAAGRLHCNGRSDFLLFDCNRKLIKIKSKERPIKKYSETPYLIAYKATFN